MRILVVFALALVGAACSPAVDDASIQADAIRKSQDQDVVYTLADGVAADASPPDAFKDIRSWNVTYVEQRDPENPKELDASDPFKGLLLTGMNANGEPLFLTALALTEYGIAHLYFSLDADASGQFLPLLATVVREEDRRQAEMENPDSDTVDAPTWMARQRIARAIEAQNWLDAERKRLAGVLRDRFPAGAGSDDDVSESSLRIQDFRTVKDGLQCVAELAIFALSIANPIVGMVAQGAVAGVAAVVDAQAGTGETADDASLAVTTTALAGAGTLAKKVLSQGAVSKLKVAGGAVAVAAVAGVVGYQLYKDVQSMGWQKGIVHGLGDGLTEVTKALIPASCQRAYKSLTETKAK